MRALRLCPLLIILCGLFISCAVLNGGNGSETTNGYVAGRLVNPGGTPASFTQVTLLSKNYNPVKDGAIPDSLIATTGETGEFLFHAPGKGEFNIEALKRVSGERALIVGIIVDENDTTVLSTCAVRMPGAVKIILPVTVDSVNGYVYLPGTTHFSGIGNNTAFIDSVPAGFIPAVNYADRVDAAANAVVKSGLTVASGDTAVVADNQLWKNSKKLVLNTTASGAAITGPVTNFPVLIRLNNANFDFSQARSDGADIRFSKADNTFLPYEIERWDAAAGHAEVWVKVDTVLGNDGTQSLMMYWGNDNAANASNSAAVFDTANGYAGVWHMDESSGALIDATADHFNGVRNGNQLQSAGCIGFGQTFKDSGDYADMGNVCNPDTSGFSVCAWIKPVLTKNFQTIIAKSPGGAPSSSYGWLIELDNTGALMTFIATGAGSWGGSQTFILASAAKIVDSTQWHHVAAVFDRSGNGKCKVYIDGVEVSSLPAGGDIAGLGAVVNAAPLRLGADANGGCPWKGSMDECSVSWKARSPDWIRLCYLNQKVQDALVKW